MLQKVAPRVRDPARAKEPTAARSPVAPDAAVVYIYAYGNHSFGETPMTPLDSPVVRSIEDQAGYRACLELQRATWGEECTELVPTSLLMVTRKIGGLLAGAFGPDDELLGFILGFAGRPDGRPIHWSHMLAVHPRARGRGLGRLLKLHQRERLLERGLEVACWTYDPLVSRNAHLNLNRLGVRVTGYESDMYGTHTNSSLHGPGGTDRFTVRWELDSERVRRTLDGEPPARAEDYADAPVLAPDPSGGPEPPFPTAPRVLIEIPADVQSLKGSDRDRVESWRQLTRAAFPWYLERGYQVEGLLAAPEDGRYCYALRAPRTGPDGSGT